MDEYLRNAFPVHLRSLLSSRPNRVVREHILPAEDEDAAFFGGRGWEHCAADLAGVPPADRPRFVLCLFALVLLDQHVFTSLRPLHPRLRSRHPVPKFGWSGFGVHNENPFLLLAVPAREGLVGTEEIAADAPAAMRLLTREVEWLLDGQAVAAADFFARLYADPGFGELAGDPARDAVVRALNVVLTERGIVPHR